MGYACPVCGDPQADAEHLANHLAFTAMLRDDGHESWLDEHVDDWGDLGPPELAERVVDLADEEEYPQVFEDTTGDHVGHDHTEHDHGNGARDGPGSSGQAVDALDDAAPGGVADLGEAFEGETDDVLAEARAMTRRRRANAKSEGADDADAGNSAEADSGEADSAEADSAETDSVEAESVEAGADDSADGESDETGDS